MHAREGPIRLATRGSDLARRQATGIQEALETRRHAVELVEVETTGDQLRDELIHRLGTTGAFVRALDEEILARNVDAAVHSMKDMPTEMPPDLVVAGVPERATPGDVLLTPDGTAFADLPAGATVGTASLRRKAEVLAERPDLEVKPLRGNVDTRVAKLLAPHRQHEHQQRLDAEDDTNERDGDGEGEEFERTPQEWFEDLHDIERRALERDVEDEFDAIVLAAAGLERSGLLRHLHAERLPSETFVPAPGQGAIAVTALDGEFADDLNAVLDHPRTRVETTVERVVLSELGGGCVAPMGAYAVVQGEHVHTTVRVLAEDGDEEVSATRGLPVERHPEAARELAGELADRGAAELIKRARDDDRGAKRAE